MNKIIQFVLILAVGLILYFLLNRMMQKLMVELSEILYKEVNPEKYLEAVSYTHLEEIISYLRSGR